MCGSPKKIVKAVLDPIVDPITPDPPKIKAPPAPPPPPPPPPPPGVPQPIIEPKQPVAPVIGAQDKAGASGSAGGGRAALVIPINLGGVAGGTGLSIPR